MASSKNREPSKPRASRKPSAPTRAAPTASSPPTSSRGTAAARKPSQAQTLTAVAEVEGDGTSDEDPWTLRLYVAGDSPKSRAALANLQRLCDTHLKGKYNIEVIDLKSRPELAKADQIVALPTLIRKVPEPMKRLIGDLSNVERALIALELGGFGGRESTTNARHVD